MLLFFSVSDNLYTSDYQTVMSLYSSSAIVEC